MKHRIELTINSDINVIKNVVEKILNNIQDSLSDIVFFNTKLILNELIINGIKHGNCEDKNKFININVSLNNCSLTIEVKDEGCGFSYNQKKMGCYDLSECGRGLMLVEGLSDKFEVKGNSVVCVQYLK